MVKQIVLLVRLSNLMYPTAKAVDLKTAELKS